MSHKEMLKIILFAPFLSSLNAKYVSTMKEDPSRDKKEVTIITFKLKKISLFPLDETNLSFVLFTILIASSCLTDNNATPSSISLNTSFLKLFSTKTKKEAKKGQNWILWE